MRLLNVAKWWDVDPQKVSRWPITKFDDREEYMLIYSEMSKKPDPKDSNELNSNEEEWKGRK